MKKFFIVFALILTNVLYGQSDEYNAVISDEETKFKYDLTILTSKFDTIYTKIKSIVKFNYNDNRAYVYFYAKKNKTKYDDVYLLYGKWYQKYDLVFDDIIFYIYGKSIYSDEKVIVSVATNRTGVKISTLCYDSYYFKKKELLKIY